METKNEEYSIGFWAHDEYHEIAIDLKCLAEALGVKLPSRFQGQDKKECECLCHRPEDHHAVYKCPCQPTLSSDAVEEKIKRIHWMLTESMDDRQFLEKELRELMALARGNK